MMILCDITWEATLIYNFNFIQFFRSFLKFLLNFDSVAEMVRDLMLEASFYFPH